MNKKPYLVSIASFTEGAEPEEYVRGYNRYYETLKNLKDSVEHIDVRLSGYPGHVERWQFFPKGLDPSRWVIFTDTPDVIFQAPIPDLDAEGKEIYAAWEGENHQDNAWWVEKFKTIWSGYTDLLDKPVYNAGTWAMKVPYAQMWVERINNIYWGGDRNGMCEQAEYCRWLNSHGDKVGVHPSLMSVLHANLSKGNIVKRGNLFMNRDNIPYSIIHGNGDTKKFL